MDRSKVNNSLISFMAIIGFALITVLFISYNRFLKPEELGTGGQDKSFLEQIVDKFNGSNTQEGEIDEIAASHVREGTEVVAGSTTTQETTTWTANDYTNGDIKSGTYTVKRGDTLWEIAEAVYGDGTQWGKLLEANKNNVGFLPNGSQALIVTGQSLVIP